VLQDAALLGPQGPEGKSTMDNDVKETYEAPELVEHEPLTELTALTGSSLPQGLPQ
jgi:hypothetical protein